EAVDSAFVKSLISYAFKGLDTEA
ncbi:MAG: hypothetical protein K0S76_3220, partial [Herbinix sp.]|nr:hypothetical protein [Herbinix sp.]